MPTLITISDSDKEVIVVKKQPKKPLFSDSDSDSDHSVGLPPPIKVDIIVKDTSGEGQDIEVGIEEVNITKETDLV